jgi:hypothetical protein
MRSLAGWILAGTIVFGSVVALAVPDMKGPYPTCSTPPTESERKAAQGAFAAGQGSFNEADYSTAIMYWRDAYRRDCTAHALLVNLARAYELKGDRTEAIEALETYLQRKADDPKVDEYQRRIQNLKAQLAAAQASASAAAASANASAPAPSTSAPPAPFVPPPMHLNVPPLIVVGAGAVLAAGVGIPIWIAGNNDVHEAEKACSQRNNCPKPIADQGNKGRENMFVGGALIAAGAAALTAGAVWYLMSPKKATPSEVQSNRVRVDPAFGSNFAGFSLGGSF